MPEVVYPSNDADGNSRTWDQVFPIWKNDDDDNDWRIIDQILEAIAMNNRFGGKEPDALRAEMIAYYTGIVKETLDGLNGEPHNHKEEFPGKSPTEIDILIPADRKKIIEERGKYFRILGRYLFYIDEVFKNLGGAYREYKR